MADRIIKGDSGNDVVIQNNDASRKIEVTNSGDIEVTGDVKTTTVKATNIKANDGSAGLVVADSSGDVSCSAILRPADIISSGTLTIDGSVNIGGKLVLEGRTELTIASGVITVTKSYHEVDTEGNAGNDDLDTINGGTLGMICTFKTADSGRDVTFKDATGNITLSGDRQLNHYQDTLTLIYDGAGWRELCFSDNTAG